jgi:hypothetical protein
MMTIRWGAAVSTRNRPDDSIRLIQSIARQAIPPAAVAVIDQSTPPMDRARDRINEIAATGGFAIRWATGGAGLSAGRNMAFHLLGGSVEWAVTPNDTSILDEAFSDALAKAVASASHASCLVGTYAYRGNGLRDPGPEGSELTGWELWRPIEPACVWNVGRVLEVGGFDERIGTGSAGAAQSGEGTDLLVRLARSAPVRVAPGIVVHGRPHDFGLDATARASKDYGYAVGTGVVYRRHFEAGRALPRLVWPLMQGARLALQGRDPAEFRYGLARARGRLYGYFRTGHALRPRAAANVSDRWRQAR